MLTGKTNLIFKCFIHRTLSFNSFPLLIGGVDNIETVLERPGQIQTDDFVGCVHSIAVNGRFLNLSTPLDSRGITEECQRVEGVCEASSYKCGSGQCVDLWDSHSCNCNGILATNCLEAFVPYSFSTGSYVEYRLGERYKRSQILLAGKHSSSESRQRRDISSKSLSLSFRTIQTEGVLLYTASEQDYTLVEVSVVGFLFN
jgi:protocadherin Fat 4